MEDRDVVRKAFLFLVAVSLLLGLSTLSHTAEKPDLEKGKGSRDDIQKLVMNLGHPDFRIREKTMKQLDAFGEPALEPLYEAKKSPNPEIRERAKLLVSDIEWRALPTKTVNGMQFKLAVAKNWRIPKLGLKDKIDIRLDLRNIGDKIYHICPGGAQVRLFDLKGKDLLSGGGSDHSRTAWY